MNLAKEAAVLPATVTGNGEAYPKQWLAVYVRLHHEKKMSERLTAMGIENFLPVQEEIHQWSDRKKKILRVLIPMLVFVRVSVNERIKVLELYSATRYMVQRGASVPLVIPDDQMERFKFMLDYSEQTIYISPAPLSVGEKVRVIKGPLAGLEGELVKADGKTRVEIQFSVFGYANVEMPVGFVEKI